MHIHYVSNIRLPTEKAHGLQITQNCEALSRHVDVTLYPAHRKQPNNLKNVSPWNYYNLEKTFKIIYVPCLDFRPLQHTLKQSHTSYFSKFLTFLNSLSYCLNVLPLLRNTDSDSIIYSRHFFILRFLKRWKNPKKFFWEVHSLPQNPKSKRAYLALIHQIGGVIVVTQKLKESLVCAGISEQKILVAHDGIKENRFKNLPDISAARRFYSLPHDAFILGYMGRLHTMKMSKGVDFLIEAISQLPHLPLHLFLVGGPKEMIEELRGLWVRKGLNKHYFHALDHVPSFEIPSALTSFNVALMPFPWTEHFAYYASPIKLFEYMACGLPVIASNLPSTQEILRDNENGLLYQHDDIESLKTAITAAYENRELRKNLGEKAKREVFEHYTWEKRAESILAFIKSSSYDFKEEQRAKAVGL